MLRKVHYQAQNQAAYKIHNKRSQGESKSTALDPPTDPISHIPPIKLPIPIINCRLIGLIYAILFQTNIVVS